MAISRTEVQPTMAGAIMGWTSASLPTGWVLCDGTSYATATYPNLFALIGYKFGGSGANFNVPNIQSRIIAGLSGANKIADLDANSVGTPSASNTGNYSADHAHNANTGNVSADHAHQFFQGGATWGSPGINANHFHGLNTGNDSANHTHSMQSHTHLTPDLVINFMIKT